MNSPRVLVTGGAGFIGSFVGERYAREGFAVRVLDDLSTGERANCDPAWELCVGDVRDAGAVGDAVADCDVVVHLAAFTSVPESFHRFQECTQTNVLGTFQVLEACDRHGTGKLVFGSSCAVYAELPDAPKRETDRPEPISPYAVSKLEGEHLLEGFAATRGLACVALRFFNVFGPRQSLASDYASAVATFARRSLRGEPLTIYGDGRQTRDFVYVEDVAEAVYRAGTGGARDVCNVGTGQAREVLALADAIVAIAGGPPEHRFEPARAGDLRASRADLTRTAAELGWQPRFALEEGLERTLAWWRER